MKNKHSESHGGLWRTTGHRLWLLFPLLLIIGIWAGCRPENKGAAGIDPVGNYALVSVDGKQVPCTVQHDGQSVAVKSGTFTINPDGTCSSRVAFSAPSGDEHSREVKAQYTQQGSKLTMKWEGAGTTTGTVEGDTFTMNNEGMIFRYRK